MREGINCKRWDLIRQTLSDKIESGRLWFILPPVVSSLKVAACGGPLRGAGP